MMDPKKVIDLSDLVKREGFLKWQEDGIDLRPFSTIGIGGKTGGVAIPISEEEIQATLEFCKKQGVKYGVRGNGSNTVYGDLDLLIDLSHLNKFIQDGKLVSAEEVVPDNGAITAQAGVMIGRRWGCYIGENNNVLAQRRGKIIKPESLLKKYEGTLAGVAYVHGLGGVDEIADIPGCVGASTKMNCGTLNQDIGGVVEEVTVITKDGYKKVFQKRGTQSEFVLDLLFRKERIDFSYRYCSLQGERHSGDIIYSVKVKLPQRDKEEIMANMLYQQQTRYDKHPAGPSNGSVIRLRGEDYKNNTVPSIHADEVIKDEIRRTGITNFGGIHLFESYPVFFVNTGKATIDDFNAAISFIHSGVRERTGVNLKVEVKYVPEDITPNL